MWTRKGLTTKYAVAKWNMGYSIVVIMFMYYLQNLDWFLRIESQISKTSTDLEGLISYYWTNS